MTDETIIMIIISTVIVLFHVQPLLFHPSNVVIITYTICISAALLVRYKVYVSDCVYCFRIRHNNNHV